MSDDLTTPQQAEVAPTGAPGPATTTPTTAKGLRVDISDLKSTYCNICNANSTREEVVLNFGVSQDWDRGKTGDIKLDHRIILSPPSAKRVAALLTKVMQDYESRYGSLT